jgi:hypothetical protein
MKLDQGIVLGFAAAAVVAAVFLNKWSSQCNGTEITCETIKKGESNPPLWIFYNDSDVNSRNWLDFGARSSYVLNIPLLNLLYQTIVNENGKEYRVEVIGGVVGAAELLGVDALPKSMKNLRLPVGEAEEDWIRTAVLAKYGGLWVSPSVIALKGFGSLPKDTVVAYGQDDVPMYSTSIPGFRALWSPYPSHPLFIEWEKRIRNRLENQLGGLQARGDAKSDWIELFNGKTGVEIYRSAELGRNVKTQKKLQLEDLLATWMHGEIQFEIPCDTVYIVIPYKDLIERRAFGWILKSSEEQILESDLVISSILRKALKQSD